MAFPMASEAWSFIISARLELSLFVAALVVPALSESEESESLVNLDDLPGLVNIQKAMENGHRNSEFIGIYRRYNG